VPHTGTHTVMNILESLDLKRRESFGHVHFCESYDNEDELDEVLASDAKIIIPLRNPSLTFVSKWKRNMQGREVGSFESNPSVEQLSLDYTLENWAVLERYLDKIDKALLVPMSGGIAYSPARIAKHVGLNYMARPYEVGNQYDETITTGKDIDRMPGISREYVARILEPAFDTYFALADRITNVTEMGVVR
jgi:hypothetical protein